MKQYIRLVALVLVLALTLTGCVGATLDDPTPTTTATTPSEASTPDVPVPEAAAESNMTRLVFYDDFDSDDTIDWDATGDAGYKWYVDRPFGWESFTREEATIADSVLTLTPTANYANWSIASYSAKGDTGTAFRYAYFEARIRIDIDKSKSDLQSAGSPAWWSFSVDHTVGRNNEHWGELDFFEVAFNSDGDYDGMFVASAHDSIVVDGKQINRSKTDNVIYDKVTEPGWHTYGCLWTPGEIYWYFDDIPISQLAYFEDMLPFPNDSGTGSDFEGCFSVLDSEQMLVVLGTGPDWPMEVDWVRIWQE